MTIATEVRKSDLYEGNGSTVEFAFPFRVFATDQITVYRKTSDYAEEVVTDTEFTVELNADQETSPGGTVTFLTAPPAGTSVRILSSVDYLQGAELQNQSAFYPATLNDVHDKLTILCQQLKEEVDRCVIVPATGAYTREELLNQLLEVASKANEYAQLAQKTYEEVLATQDEIEELQKTFESTVETASDEAIAAVEAKKTEVVTAVNDAGQEQYDRLQAIGDWAASQLGASCQEATLTISEAVASGAEVTLPVGVQYLAGKKHMRVAWNGIILPHGHLWTDIDSEDTFSGRFKILMPLSVGDQINVFIAPLGTEDFANEIARIAALEEAMADLSQRVVYKDEESA